jgi:hypothetical protein
MTNTRPRARGTQAFALFYRLQVLKVASGHPQYPSWSTAGRCRVLLLLEGDPPATTGEVDLTFDLEAWGQRVWYPGNWSVGRFA